MGLEEKDEKVETFMDEDLDGQRGHLQVDCGTVFFKTPTQGERKKNPKVSGGNQAFSVDSAKKD